MLVFLSMPFDLPHETKLKQGRTQPLLLPRENWRALLLAVLWVEPGRHIFFNDVHTLRRFIWWSISLRFQHRRFSLPYSCECRCESGAPSTHASVWHRAPFSLLNISCESLSWLHTVRCAISSSSFLSLSFHPSSGCLSLTTSITSLFYSLVP